VRFLANQVRATCSSCWGRVADAGGAGHARGPPLGRRVVKRLYHDRRRALLALGTGPAPRSFDRFLAESPPRLRYARVDLARHRPVSDLFHSERVREAGIDTLVHVPRHGAGAEDGAPVAAGLPLRVAEARIVLSHALATTSSGP
jgi:hypothetical protein